MDVIEAINTRRSVRAYTSQEVPRSALDAIVAAASRTPSWANTQPWEVYVVQGSALARLREGFAKCRASGVKPHTELAVAGGWTPYCKSGTQALQEAQKRDCGEDFKLFGKQNQDLFGAPVVVYPCMDKALGHWSLYDIGAWVQTFMLAAREFGLDTVVAYTLTLYPDVIHEVAGMPDNLEVTMGVALGYADNANGLNNLQSPRRDLEQSTHWVS
jgi:nitroreductase